MQSYWRTQIPNYRQLHYWVERQLGKPRVCSKCGIAEDNRRYEWANVSNQYKKDVSDWIRLCVPCHRKATRNAHPVCTNGHKLTNDNVYIRKTTGYKQCKQCRQAYRNKFNNREVK